MHGNESFSEVELEEIKSLADLFSDIPLSTIRALYQKFDRDYKAAQEACAQYSLNPDDKSQLLQPPVSTQGRQSSSPDSYHDDDRMRMNGAMGAGVAATGLAALALAPAPSDPPGAGTYLPTLPSFDVNTLTETLTQVGTSVSDGITSIATNITGWVADLASAFDAGWGDEGEERPVHTSDKDEPSVGYGSGLGIDRPYQRRLVTNTSSGLNQNIARIDPDAEQAEEDDWDEGEDGYGKDD